MLRILLTGAALLTAATIMAESWSLDSCISYALSHNITVKQREADRDMGQISLEENINGFLPTMSAGANESFSFGRGLTADNTYANRNTSSFGWSVSLNVPLTYALGQGQARVKQSRTYLQALLHQWEAARENVELNVISAYLQVLYARELLAVAQGQTELSERQLQERHTLLDAGKIAELDVLQAESQLAQDRLNQASATNDLTTARLELMQLLELPRELYDSFDILPVEMPETLAASDVESVYNNALRYNGAIQAQLDNVEYARQGITVARTAYIPSVGLSAGLGSSYYNLSGATNDSFAHQMRHNFSQSVGLSLSVPLFDAFSRHNSVRRARANHLNANLSLIAAQEQLYKTITTARTQALNAQSRLVAAGTAADAALASLEAVNRKYTYDRATPTEVEQAKTTYARAASEAVRAKYELILRLRILDFYNRPNF